MRKIHWRRSYKIFHLFFLISFLLLFFSYIVKFNLSFNIFDLTSKPGMNLNSTKYLIPFNNFEDKYFQRVLNVFKNNEFMETKEFFRQGNVPTFYLYTNNGLETKFWQKQLRHIINNECPFHCKVTGNITESSNVDAIILYLRHLKSRKFVQELLPKRDPKQPWIMLTFEAPLMANDYKANYKEFDFIFNRTMMYRKDADIIVNHGFVVSKRDAEFLPNHWRIPILNLRHAAHKSNKAVIVGAISNCHDTSGRLDYINILQKYMKVDIYGWCGKFKCGQSLFVEDDYKPNMDECFLKFGTSYMFYLAFENSFCTDYGTEKIYNLLYYPIVPIVFGGINYEEILPPDSYINIAHYSPKELASYIKYLVANPNAYKKYFKWKEYYTPSTIGGERILCDLCTRLHDPKFYEFNLVENFYKWFYTDSECDRKWTISNRYKLGYKTIF